MFTYNEAAHKIERRGTAKVANNTRLHRVDADTIGVELHATDVVLIHSDGTYAINSGGWRTVTTKDRINTFSPARVYSVKGTWYIGDGVPFEDGMIVGPNGVPTNPPDTTAAEQSKTTDSMIKKYINEYHNSLIGKGLPDPNSPDRMGDCWGCLFTADGGNTGPYAGREPMGLDHYISHFRDGYYVPSLLKKAIIEAGYVNPGAIWWLIDRELKDGKPSNTLKRTLRKFFSKRRHDLIRLIAAEAQTV